MAHCGYEPNGACSRRQRARCSSRSARSSLAGPARRASDAETGGRSSAYAAAKLGSDAPNAHCDGCAFSTKSVHKPRPCAGATGRAQTRRPRRRSGRGGRRGAAKKSSRGSACPPRASRRAARRRAARRKSRAGAGTAGSCVEVDLSAPTVASAETRDDQQPLGNARNEILERDRGRVDVRESLVGLVDGEREEGERGATPPAATVDRDGRRPLIEDARARGSTPRPNWKSVGRR